MTIVRLIGRGGQAAVYSGRWLGVPVAVKVTRHLRKNHALRKEASFLSRLRHPSVCALYGHTLMPDGSSALLLELLPSTLTALLEQPQPLPACLAGRIASEVAAGIGFLHRNNVMHRDIKPSNVLLDGSAHAKVADFGIATLVDKTSSRASPSSSASTATASSASPPSSGHTAGIGTRYFMATAPSPPSTPAEYLFTPAAPLSRRPRCAPPPRWSSGLPTTSSATSTRTGCCSGPSCTRGDAHSREVGRPPASAAVRERPPLPFPVRHPRDVDEYEAGSSLHDLRPATSLLPDRAAFADLIRSCLQLQPASRRALKPPSRRGPLSEPVCAFSLSQPPRTPLLRASGL